jgi:hypothetical protein
MEMVRATERKELERLLEKGGVTFSKVLFRVELLRKTMIFETRAFPIRVKGSVHYSVISDH